MKYVSIAVLCINLIFDTTLHAEGLGYSLGTTLEVPDYDAARAAFDRRDYAAAFTAYYPLAEQGNVRAQDMIGMLYSFGWGVPANQKEAAHWYSLAVAQGSALSAFGLGGMYRDGSGVPKNFEEALRLYRLAAMGGVVGALDALGTMHRDGEGVLQDNITAHMWFNMSGARGKTASMQARDKLENRMTPADISQAQDAARTCMSSGYKDCR